jgi:hypothetical protein
MKDLGVPDIILEVKLLRDENGGTELPQSYYVEKVLSHFGYRDCMYSPRLQHHLILACCFERIEGLLEIS